MTRDFIQLVSDCVKEANEDSESVDEFCKKHGMETSVIYAVSNSNLKATLGLVSETGQVQRSFEAFGCTMFAIGVLVGKRLLSEDEGNI